jgi:hypothetical protein
LKVRRDPLDILFSNFIRMRAGWSCERCGSMPARQGLHCHHFIRRRNQNTRYDPDNGVSLCLGCHQYLSENRDEEEIFMIRKLGQQGVDLLRSRSRQIKPDKELIRLYLREQIRLLENGVTADNT